MRCIAGFDPWGRRKLCQHEVAVDQCSPSLTAPPLKTLFSDYLTVIYNVALVSFCVCETSPRSGRTRRILR